MSNVGQVSDSSRPVLPPNKVLLNEWDDFERQPRIMAEMATVMAMQRYAQHSSAILCLR